MKFYRLIKPNWAKPELRKGTPNPDFIRSIDGPDTLDGYDFGKDFLRAKNEEGYNVYFFPNHPSKDVFSEGQKFLNGKSIDVFNFLFVDMDLKDGVYGSKDEFLDKLKEFELVPTMVVDSGHGIHAYWAISDLTREKYVLGQMALLNYFKTDTSVWTVLQLMRMPGYKNTKQHDAPVMASVLQDYSCGEVYDFDDLPKSVFALPKDLVRKGKDHLAKLDGKQDVPLTEDLNIDDLPPRFSELLKTNEKIKDLFEDPISYGGDRSAADMALANHLFTQKFNVNEAMQVLANTEKARAKGLHRFEYAKMTVDKVYSDRPKHKFQNAAQFLAEEHNREKMQLVRGPSYLDFGVLGEPWRKQELLGIIAGSGIGKTAFALNIIREIIGNNPESDDVYVFFSIEMPKKRVIERWVQMVGESSPLTHRLYVVDNQDENGMPVSIGLQEMYAYCEELKAVLGREIGAIVIDHFHIVSTKIDVEKTPNFGIEDEQHTGYGKIRNLSLNGLATQLKSLVKALDTFGIILTQTTKEKGTGDLPIGKDGAYGVSQFEWIVDRILTIWQPLMRVQNLTDTHMLAYQYVKIREKRPNDRIKEYNQKLLTYDMGTGKLRIPTESEYETFQKLYPTAMEIRQQAQKKSTSNYSIQLDLDDIDDLLEKLC